jgi:hypothetical protein
VPFSKNAVSHVHAEKKPCEGTKIGKCYQITSEATVHVAKQNHWWAKAESAVPIMIYKRLQARISFKPHHRKTTAPLQRPPKFSRDEAGRWTKQNTPD